MDRLRRLLRNYPSQFWVLVVAAFIDRLGGALLFPFFTLYVTQKFNLGMTEVGGIFAVFSLSSVVGSLVGGALTDRLGRKSMLLFGLVMSALTSILMGIVDSLTLFLGVSVLVGVLANAGGPAQQAMVADLLPEEQRAEGFGILRVVINLSFTIGPMLGGLLAAQSYLLLFVTDAVASVITAVIVALAIKETRPEPTEEEGESMAQTLAGYGYALRDVAFLAFLGASVLMVLVYMQMNTTLSVFLRDVHGLDERGYGYLLSLNAAMVVLLQFPVTRYFGRYRPLMVMTAGTLCYGLGFALFGFVASYPLFLLAIAIITLGEMMVSPVGQSIVARIAPEQMRGRYMATYGFSWVIPTALGPLLAGLVMDNVGPYWVWYAAGMVSLVAAAGYYLIELRASRVVWDTVAERLRVMEMLEEGELTAVEASKLLQEVEGGAWAKLAPSTDSSMAGRHLRVRVTDPISGALTRDFRLPVALVNLALDSDSALGGELDGLEPELLQKLVSPSGPNANELEMGDGHMELFLEEADAKPEEIATEETAEE